MTSHENVPHGTLPPGHGELPPWNVAELAAPPRFSFRNALKVIGPGAIMAATSIGGGEWLVGPAAAVKYSSQIFLIATVAIALQVIFNLEAIRYTLYTGEPILAGIMRLSPGPRVWAGFYTVLGFFQLGWPALAGSAAATLLGAWIGRMPGAGDQATHAWVATALILAVVAILLFGGTIERMLEYFAWVMLGVVFTFLLVVNVVFVPATHWLHTFAGFFRISGLPDPVDWSLLAALPATGENLTRWREWLRYVHVDQIWVWGLLCFVGMFLNVNMATAIVPHGTDLQGLAAGAYQAEYLAKVWPGFWFLTLFNGFWILFKTQLGNTDVLVRTTADAVFIAHPRVREGLGIRAIYYGILLAFSVWGVLAVRSASPFQLFKVLANIAGLVLVIAGIQILRVNRRFLPKAVRPPLWREAGLLLCVAFYAFFSWFGLQAVISGFFR